LSLDSLLPFTDQVKTRQVGKEEVQQEKQIAWTPEASKAAKRAANPTSVEQA
jgi:hypothetical protein